MKENQRGIKMICEMYNKMEIVGDYIVDGGTDDTEYFEITSVTLYEFLEMCFLFMLVVVCLSWWMVPGRIISKPFLDRAKNISFECKKRE